MDPKEFVFRNIREPDTGEEYEELKQSIAEIGVRKPVEYYIDGDDKVIKDGHRRVTCALELELDDVPAVRVARPTEEERIRDQLLYNVLRLNLDPIETANTLAKLKNRGRNGKDLAKELGKSESWISQHLGLLELSSSIQGAVRDGKMAMKAGYECKALPADDQERFADQLMAAKTVRGVKRFKAVIEAIKETEGDAPPKQLTDVGEEEIQLKEAPNEDLLRVLGLLEMGKEMIQQAQREAEDLGMDINEHVSKLREEL